jgi:hypothetical protein
VQFLTTGVLSEMMTRTYFESSQTRSYIIRENHNDTHAGEADWKYPE